MMKPERTSAWIFIASLVVFAALCWLPACSHWPSILEGVGLGLLVPILRSRKPLTAEWQVLGISPAL